ncbi:MAG: glycosyltransferase [Patescibacteria group bacterium]|nr:glycosyltransferase [Patescibacteria group bacterium]
MRIALVVPHLFMHQEILPDVIFSPGWLAIDLACELARSGHQVTIFSPGPIKKFFKNSEVDNVTADLSLFEAELEQRGYGYIELLKKHPLTYITLARQVQSEIVAQAYEVANQDKFDLVHIWCNEEELALVNARFCQKPVVFNHHEPFNFLTRYRAIFPKYKHLNWVSFSHAQRVTLANDVNWVSNVYHGLPEHKYHLEEQKQNYLLYMGRIIRPKGVHYAIELAKKTGLKLKIAGKHYADHSKDKYWQEFIKPEIDDEQIEYVGFVKKTEEKQKLVGKARALLIPSTWQEPFGMVMIEALACGTPVIGFDQGSIPEIVKDGETGFVVEYQREEKIEKNGHSVAKDFQKLKQDRFFLENLQKLKQTLEKIKEIDAAKCRQVFDKRFTTKQVVQNYESLYQDLIQ